MNNDNEHFIGETTTGLTSIYQFYQDININNFNEYENKPYRKENIHNPQIAFWKRAVAYYDVVKNAVNENNYFPLFEDYALIISDLGISLYFLFGRNWTNELRKKYEEKIGTAPKTTRDLMTLIANYYPKSVGWNLKEENESLFIELETFINKYYKDLIKHYEQNKFQNAIALSFDNLTHFMETVRGIWIWFIEKKYNTKYEINNSAFQDFNREFK